MQTQSPTLLRLACIAASVLLGAACTDLTEVTAPALDVSPSFEIVPGETCDGRMTGGGFDINIDGVKISKGLTLHCDAALSNNLNIKWDGGHWHIQREQIYDILCLDDPAYDPSPPDAPFDTFIARANGRLDNQDNSIIEFIFIDDGEPGTGDRAGFTIYAPNQGPGQVAPGDEVIVLQVDEDFIDGGNLQAHFDQPHNNGNGRG